MTLNKLAPTFLAAVEDELHRAIGSGPPTLHEYYVMLEYHLGWVNDEAGHPPPSGKRIRPLLCLLSCAAAGGQWEQALPMAAAIELLHNFSLIHDDIQDNSPLRRGRPTLWVKWGSAQAINAGDAMFTLAHLAPHDLTTRGISPAVALAALKDFDLTCLKLTHGQYLDMSFEGRQHITVSEYLEMIEAKTSVLIATAAKVGARLAGADEARVDHFYECGRNLGLAFQILDDLLGIWGDPSITGKSAATDLEKRKKSLPVVYGLEHSAEFREAYAKPHQPEDSLIKMADELQGLGARAYAQQMAEHLSAEALRHLEAAQPTGEASVALDELRDQLLRRNQ